MTRRQVPLAELLARRDYGVFYDVIHHMSEVWLSALLEPGMMCRVASTVIDRQILHVTSLESDVRSKLQAISSWSHELLG